MNEVKEKKKIGLTTRIFIALIAGAIVGIALNMFAADVDFVQNVLVNGIFYVVGQGFIRLMQMLVVPLVFCSLICGATAIGDSKTLGKVGVKIIGFYIFTTMMAVAVALGIGLLIKPGMGLDMSQIQTAEVAASSDSVSFAETLLNIIPKNPIGALANGEMLQVIVFALIVGVILAKLQDKTQLVTNFFQQGNDIMMEMTMMVMGLAPIGVFCLIAKTFAGLGFSAMVPMFKYMGAVLLALFIQCCGVYQILLALLTRLNPLRFLKKFAPVMGFAFSTATSNATIPMNIDTLEEKIGVNRRISSFTIPLGATINMDGTSIMQGVAVVFVAQAFGIQLTPADYLTVIATATLASIGTAGVPSVGLVTLAMVFDSVGLPVAGIGLIMGIDRILDMARTAVNITGDAVCTTIVAHQDGARNLATAARRIDAKFIQISTDDVFGGDEDKAFCEFDDPHPTTMYGKSKYAGEKLVRELTDKHVIVRSSWLYGVGSYDFVDRVLDTATKEGAVHLPEDEISSPTSAEALAGFIDCLMHSREYGLFHASCDGSCSRAEYAREILRLAGKENVPVTSASENTALRPRFTLLDNMMLRITGLYQMPDWHDALSAYMSHRQTGVNK